MKKFLSIVLSIAVMLTMMSVVSFAADQPTVTVQSIEEAASVGDEVKLEVAVTDNPGFTDFAWKIDYDKDRLELKGFETSYTSTLPQGGNVEVPYLPNFLVESNTETAKIAAAGSEAWTDDGTLFCVVFEVKENARSGSADVLIVKVNDVNNLEEPVAFNYENGYVSVAGTSGGSGSSGSAGGGGGGTETYTVNFDTDGASGIPGQKIEAKELVAKPTDPKKEGYVFGGWYTDKALKNQYNFSTPVTKSFTLYAKWTKEDATTSTLKFTDVKETDWFYEAVNFAFGNNLVNGISETEFSPNAPLTRGMLITIIYRMENEPESDTATPYSDVNAGDYYAAAVAWANKNAIVNGVSDTEFAPNTNVTREQIATIIYRYVQYKAQDISVAENANMSSYTDTDSVSEYASDAMRYAVGSGLMKGRSESTLNPTDNASRAEFVQIMYNFFN